MHLKSLRIHALVFGLSVLCATVLSAQNTNSFCACQIPDGPPNPRPYLVGYLGVYKNMDWLAYAQTLDFTRMTHLNLAFINPPMCAGTCTADSDLTLAGNPSFTDDALRAIVEGAHARGTKVLISIGGAGGDRRIMQFYNAGLSEPLTSAIDAYLKKHNLDGVDVDVEQPKQMGVPYTMFVNTLIARLRPQGKLITAAVAQYIQAGAQDEVLPLYDIVNVMIYGSYERSVADMAYWANVKRVPKEKLTLGIGFHNYSTIVANYPNAWAVDTVGGGAYRDGAVITYQGENTVARLTQLSAQYGGAMIWELTQDDPSSSHSLLKAIQKNLDPATPRIPVPAPARAGGN